jgi:hypothetical protein
VTDDLVKRLREEDPECGLRHSLAMEAADEIEKLQSNMTEAMNHAIKEWKENGMKVDDQLGVVALILAAGLGLTEKKDGN